MIKTYLKIAFRNLVRNKIFSVINIVGLAAGMTACILIFQYVHFELSYDDFRKLTVYRISDYGYMNEELIGQRAQTAPAIAPAMERDIPEVIHGARLVHTDPLMSGPVMRYGNRSFHEDKIYFADQTIIDMFSYRLIKGNPDKALNEPNSVILSVSMAHKYFPDQDALGQTITFYQGERGQSLLKVTGIFEDIPENSHIHTDFMVSFSSLPWNLDENWEWGNFYNYIEVLPRTDPEVLKQKVNDVLEAYRSETLSAWRKVGYTRELDLQPIQEIHLDSHLEAEAETNGDRNTIRFLSIIAIFIMVIAWINYLNLTTSRSYERAREIGIRKIVGSNRSQLIVQLLSESFIVNLFAFLLAVTFTDLLMPSFRNFTQSSFTGGIDFDIGLILITLFLTGVLLSSLYPALMLSSFHPLKAINGKIRGSGKSVFFRKGLVIFQFATSIALITGTLAIHRQIRYMRKQDLGLNMDQTLIVKGPGIKDSTYHDHMAYFRDEINRQNVVKEVSVSSNIPGNELSWGRSFYQPAHPDIRPEINIIAVDEDFLRLYGVNFLAGRNFSQEYSSDRGAVILNKTAIRRLGFQDAGAAVNQLVIWEESEDDLHKKEIIGVIKDFNQESLHKEVVPIVFVLKKYLNAPWAGEFYSIKINTNDYPAALADIQESWESAFPGSPFDYFFLDEYFNEQYKADQQFGTIFSFFSGLAILIACLGLFGLSLFITIQRTKEIGIRKVLGATTQSVVALLSRDFLLLILVASALIIPVVYIAIGHWLENFAYHMEIRWWLLLMPVLLVWLMALFTISIQTVKASLANPARTLRYE